MAAGIRIFNDDGVIQIDDMFNNLFLNQSGTVTTDYTATTNGPSGLASLLINTPEPPIVGIACETGATIGYKGRVGGTWQYYIRSANPNTQVRWYAFGPPQNVPFQSGLRIFNERGEITFDSNQKPLCMSYFFDLPVPILPSIADTINLALVPENPVRPANIYVPLKQGRTYAAFPVSIYPLSILYKQGFFNSWLRSFDHYIYVPQSRSGGVNFYAKVAATGYRSPNVPDGYLPNGGFSINRQQYWLIDVTGY